MPKYRKLPVEIEAILWDGTAEEATPIITWADSWGTTINYQCIELKDGGCPGKEPGTHVLDIQTLEGEMQASVGDYIIKGVKNEFYPCKPDIFKATYEEVS